MELTDQYWLSEYQDLGQLNEKEKIHIVRNQLSGAICVRKYVDPEMEGIYQFLKSHPNPYIPRIYHCIRQDSRLIIIEEYLTGKNLEELCREHCFEEKESAEIIVSLCRALEPLHNANPAIICRDLKAANVMLTLEGTVKLVDFDIARVYQQGKGRDTVMMGTEHYAAPEQFGFAQTDARTDIYGMGVLLNYLLTGKYPVEYISNGNLNGIIRKCTALKPEERYQTVMELRGDLECYLHCNQGNTVQQEPRLTEGYRGEQAASDRKRSKSFLLPGFRSRKIWKMCVAVLGYILITVMCFTMDFQRDGKNLVFPMLQLNQLFCWAAQIATVFYICNYQGFHDKWKLPLVHSPSRGLRICGYALAWLIFMVIASVVCVIIEMIFSL